MKRLIAMAFAMVVLATAGTAVAQSPERTAYRACEPVVTRAVRDELGARQRVQFFADSTRLEFVSNAENKVRGRGQYETRRGFSEFSYVCTYNHRTGETSKIRVVQR
ncbi:hypothetical protein [Acuticoccus mangrovi]|uniref:Uncharacterized protein n=1 Tax=Acuticoccus mangrovi TaxID=2796142 RepID=A0A934IIW2_9HYPH|nr:hypothetical protein [Acuticoccus mangrovi]MBJ3777288.1 hypothetical protein [Acuticoccus mangrovi]